MPTYTPLEWDQEGQRLYETGIDHGVLWIYDPTLNSGAGGWTDGIAWNGLTAVSEKPSGAEPTALYADNIKYLNLLSTEEFACTIEAYTYPPEFAQCDGSADIATGISIGQQKRLKFAFSYQTKIGSDTDGNDKGKKIHIVYGCLAAPSEKAYNTINDSPEAITFSWEVSTTPIEVSSSYKPTALLTIDSTKVSSENWAKIEAKLYGSANNNSTYQTPSDILTLIA